MTQTTIEVYQVKAARGLKSPPDETRHFQTRKYSEALEMAQVYTLQGFYVQVFRIKV